MTNRIIFILTFISIFQLAGCATPTKMAFHDDANPSAEARNPVFLLTATLKNTYKPEHQPKLLIVNVERSEVNGSEDRINFTMDDKAKYESDDPVNGSSYLLRMELETGNYVIRGFTSMSSSFPFHGSFFAPLHESIEVNGSGIYYLGHINATVRERSGEEFKAGPSIPLIDQAIVGASSGTFDIEVSDRWEKDEKLFRNNFSALTKAEIKMAILPPFDRQRAQKWWEEH